MAIETASYINQLVAANPLSTDAVSQADDHIRMIKAVLKATFPNLDSPVTATPAQLNYQIPKGCIVLWSGTSTNIPTGWALCNGSNGTPDLRNRFVLGSPEDGINIPSSVGGSTSTSPGGSHTHTVNGANANQPSVTTAKVAAPKGDATDVTVVTAVGAPVDHTHTLNLVPDHTHVEAPQYMVLCYIMRL